MGLAERRGRRGIRIGRIESGKLGFEECGLNSKIGPRIERDIVQSQEKRVSQGAKHGPLRKEFRVAGARI